MAARREELGGPPTPEEILAYRDGLLDSAARENVEAKLAVYPDAAHALADLAAFPETEAAPGVAEISDAALDARWKAFRRRLNELPQHAASTQGNEEAKPGSRGEMRPKHRPASLRLAAAVLLGAAVGWLGGSMRGPGRESRSTVDSAIDVTITEVAPVGRGGVRAAPEPIRIPPGSEELVLVLGALSGEAPAFSSYDATLLDSQGRRIWYRQGLHPTPLGTFQLSFRRAAVPPGRYELRLSGRRGVLQTLLATYDLRLIEPAPAR